MTATTTATTTATEAGEATTTSVDVDTVRAGRLGGRPAQQLAELFEAHAALVLGICRGMLRHAQDAEDAAQQTFLSAYASLAGGTVPREPAAWLATIARNECRTRVRRQMREPVSAGEPWTGDGDPADRVVRAEELESLRHALAGLPGQQRSAFLLREFSGLSYDELAGALGVTRPAVESLLFRARQQLRVSLRTALAGVATVPGNARDWLAQLFAGSPESAAAIAKIGSLPIAAKIATATAGTALVTAGLVAGTPHREHPAAKAAPPVARPVRLRPSATPPRRVAVVRPVAAAHVVSATPQSAHEDGEHRGHRTSGPVAIAEPRQSEPTHGEPATSGHQDHQTEPVETNARTGDGDHREGATSGRHDDGEHPTQTGEHSTQTTTVESTTVADDHVDSSGDGGSDRSGDGGAGSDRSGDGGAGDEHSGSGT